MRLKYIAGVSLALLAGACGGGGTGTIGVSPTPTPTPPPTGTPTPSPVGAGGLVRPSATTAAAASAQILTVNTAGSGTSARSVQAPPTRFSITYDAASQRYTLENDERIVRFGPSEFETEANLPDLFPRVEYELRGPGEANFLVFFKSPNSNPAMVFRHAGHGAWQQNASVPGGTRVRLDYFTYGEPTPAASMPRTGVAIYRFAGTGNYAEDDRLFFAQTSGTIRVDFAAGTFEGSVGFIGTDFFGGNFGGLTTLRVQGTIRDNGSTGAATSSWATWGGNYRLQFYGPQAQELGISLSGIGLNGSVNGALIGVTP